MIFWSFIVFCKSNSWNATSTYKRVQGIQLPTILKALITAYSSLVNVEKRDTELFKTEFLPNTIKSFTHFRAGE